MVGVSGALCIRTLMARRRAFCGSTKRIEGEHVWPHWAADHFVDDGAFTYYRQFVGESEMRSPDS
jgi:hypothetical protein